MTVSKLRSTLRIGTLRGVGMASLLVAGCSGGGSGTGATAPLTSPPPPQPMATYNGTTTGKTAVALMYTSGSTFYSSVGSAAYGSSLQSSAAPSGQTLVMTIDGTERSAAMNGRLEAGSNGRVDASAVSASGMDSIEIWNTLGAQTLSHSYAGVGTQVHEHPTTPVLLAYGVHGGSATPVSDMPTSGVATYSNSGGFLGIRTQVSPTMANPVAVRGDVEVTAHFGAASVVGTIDNMSAVRTGTPMTDRVTFDASIAGNTFTTTSVHHAGLTDVSGLVTGGFYGPQAAETAGAIALHGDTMSNDRVILNGAFAAKRQ